MVFSGSAAANGRFARLRTCFALITLIALSVFGQASRADAQTTYTCGNSGSDTNCRLGVIGGQTTASSSTLNVSGATGPIASIKVVLNGVVSSIAGNYVSMGWANFLLKDPAGNKKLLILGGTGDYSDNGGLTGLNITIADGQQQAPDGFSTALAAWPQSGNISVEPSSYYVEFGNSQRLDTSTSDWPQKDGSATLSSKFQGDTANGGWTLSLDDEDPNGSDPVSITGWQLILTYSSLISTTTTVSTSLNPSYTSSPNNSTTLVATVTSGATGTVAFTANGSTITGCGAQPLSGGVATCTTSFSSEGNHAIAATYSGSGTYATSSSSSLNEIVENHTVNTTGNTYCNQGVLSTVGSTNGDLIYPSYITVPSSVTNSVANVSVQLNGLASSNGSSGALGSTSFMLVSPGKTNSLDFLSHIASAAPQSSVNLTIADGSALAPNSGTISSGTYGATDNAELPDSFYAPPAGIPAPPTTINYPLPYGAATAENLEQAFSGATAAGSWMLYVENDANIPLNLSGGWCITLTLNTGVATVTTVSSSKNPQTTGQNVTFTATVTSGGSPVTTGGTVTFLDNGQPPTGGNNVVSLNGSGQAQFTTSQLTEGDHKITATYSGDAQDNGSIGTLWQRIDDGTAPSFSSGVYFFCNAGPVGEVQGNKGAFTPNPSNIFVSNLPGTVSNVTLSLNNFYTASDSVDEMESLIEGPNGSALDFFSSTGSSTTVVSAGNYTFSDSGAVVPQANFSPGTYKPTSYNNVNNNADSFFSSSSGFYNAPSFTYAQPRGTATFGSLFDGINGNGTWSLFFNQLNNSSAAGAQNGWCVSFTETQPSVLASTSHSGSGTGGDFPQGATNQQITVEVTNQGNGSTGDPTGTNPLKVTDTLNSNLTFAGVYSGSGWACSGTTTVTCTNDTAVAQSSSYPSLTIDVNVSNTASGNLSNSVSVIGAGITPATSNTDLITVLASTTTTASSTSAGYSASSQSVTLQAAVTSNGSNVNGGTVTFTVFNSGTTVGSPVTSGTVSSGTASASFTMPGGTAAGVYTITATYNPSGSYEISSDSTHTLTISQAATTTAASSVVAAYSASSQTITMTAAVSSAAGTVNEGTVTFAVLSGATPIGTPVTSATVSAGSAAATYTLPAGTAGGTYTIAATYNAGADFATSSDNTHTLSVAQAPQITSASSTAFQVGTAGSFTVTASGYPASTFSETGALPSGVTLNSAGVLSGTPMLGTQGNYSITITAANGTSPNASQSFTLTVNPPPYLVVNTAIDDAGSASNCTVQTTPASNTTDSACSLRDALLESAALGASSISFDSSQFATAQNITLANGTLTIPPNTAITGTVSSTTHTNLVTVSGGGSSSNFVVFAQVQGSSSIANLTISQGHSNSAGGISSEGTLTVSNCTFSNNSGYGGGAIYSTGTLTVSDSTFTHNSATTGGGAIFNDAAGTVIVSNSTFSANSSSSGGAIDTQGNAATVTNSTFSGNSASSGGTGGAIFNYGSVVSVNNNIFSGNSASSASSGAGIYSLGNTVSANTNVYWNNLSGGAEDDCENCSPNTNAISGNPNLAPVGYYGGPTQTMLPLPGSAAICAASQLLIASGVGTDQRGFPNTNTTYPGYSTTACVDAGAVQTNYSMSISSQPAPISPATFINVNTNFQAAVTLNENGTPAAPAVTVPLTLTGGGTLTGGSATTSGGIAAYSTLKINAASPNDTLTAALPLNGSLSPALALTSTSSTFPVGGLPFGWLGLIVDARTRTATVAQSDNLLVSGVALDVQYGAPISMVKILIDGSVVGNATLGVPRPDVVADYNNSAYLNSGWTFSYAASGLSVGTHTLSAIAYSSPTVFHGLGARTFTVGTVSTVPPFGWVGRAEDSRTYSNTVAQSDSLVVSGWAADPQQGAPVSQVQILIDGSVAGNATLGGPRPDIAAGYTSADLNSGWTFSYAASGLSLGTHSVTAVVYDSLSLSTTLNTVTFTVATTSTGSPLGWVGTVQDATSGGTTVAQAHSLKVSGWAADPQDGAPVSQVKILIDGNAVGTATLGGSRPDIVAQYNNSAYLNSGWTFTYAATGLSLGTHTVTAIAYDSLSLSTTLNSQTFTVAITSSGPPIGYAGAAQDATTGLTTVSKADNLLVGGWAADPHDGAPVSQVQILIDGTVVGNATLGLPRPDIDAAFNNPAYLNSGWKFLYPASGLSTGTHTVTVVAHDSLSLSTTIGTRTITVQ